MSDHPDWEYLYRMDEQRIEKLEAELAQETAQHQSWEMLANVMLLRSDKAEATGDALLVAYTELEKELAALKIAVEELGAMARREHFILDDDCWYSCPASGVSGRCRRDDNDKRCDCGADEDNARLDAILAKLKPAARAEEGGES